MKGDWLALANGFHGFDVEVDDAASEGVQLARAPIKSILFVYSGVGDTKGVPSVYGSEKVAKLLYRRSSHNLIY